MFIGPDAEGDLVRLQRDFYQKYEEQRELSQHGWDPCIPHFPLHPLALLSASYLKERMEKFIESCIFK